MKVFLFSVSTACIKKMMNLAVNCALKSRGRCQKTYRCGRSGMYPSLFPCYQTVDDDYLTVEPGLFPDPLMPLPNNTFFVNGNYYGSLWLRFRQKTKPCLPETVRSACVLSTWKSGKTLDDRVLALTFYRRPFQRKRCCTPSGFTPTAWPTSIALRCSAPSGGWR